MALQPIAPEIIEKAGTLVAVTAGSGAAVAGLTFNEWLAVAGLTIAVVSLVFDIWFKLRRLKRMKPGDPE